MRVVLIGAHGQLGRQIPADVRLGHQDFDLASPDMSVLDRAKPEGIFLTAAYTDVDGCESNRDYAFAVNAAGPRQVARWCRDHGAWLLHVSTNCVFSGERPEPYLEDDVPEPRPVSIYGASKLAGEEAVREELQQLFIVRTAWIFGPGGNNFVTKILAAATSQPVLRGVEDEISSPTYAPDLAAGLTRLADTGRYGTYHLTNSGACSRLEYMRVILDTAGLRNPIEPIHLADFARPARPPAQSALANTRAAALGITLRPWQEAVREYVATLKVAA